jgi:hypothetical protein
VPRFAIVFLVLVVIIHLGRLNPVSVGHELPALCSIACCHHYPISAPVDGDAMKPRLQTGSVDRIPEVVMSFICPTPSIEGLSRGTPAYDLAGAQHENVSVSHVDHLHLWHVGKGVSRHIAWHGSIQAP